MADLTEEQKQAASKLLGTIRIMCVLSAKTANLAPDTVAQLLFLVAGEIAQNFDKSITLEDEHQGKTLVEMVKDIAPEYVQHGADNFKKYEEMIPDGPAAI